MAHGIIGKCANNKSAKWVQVGGKKSWQQKCSKCGRLRIHKPLFSFHIHRWKKDRRFRTSTLTCKICQKKRQTEAHLCSD